jgi:spore coat polysaccharide biosynthesis protein SpsF
MTKQLNKWKGKFGDEYIERNRYDPAMRKEEFNKFIPEDVKTICEVGCNIGNNLETLKELGFTTLGVEPNKKAVSEGVGLGRNIIEGDIFNLTYGADLVLTCGVLEHIATKDLKRAFEQMAGVAKRYLLIIEYTAPQETEIEYRGEKKLLWKREYESYLPSNFRKIAGGETKDFDGSTWLLAERNKIPGIIIPTRLNSSRLPGKVMLTLGDKPVLQHVIENSLASGLAVVVAATTNPEDDIIERLCDKIGVPCFRGEPTAVNKRFYDCALKYRLDPIIRVTHDCPFVEPGIIQELYKAYQSYSVSDYNYISFEQINGKDCEIFSFNDLKKTLGSEDEHVTTLFRQGAYKKLVIFDEIDYPKLSLDTLDDFVTISKFYADTSGD